MQEMDRAVIKTALQNPTVIQDILDAQLIFDDDKLKKIYNIYLKTKKIPSEVFLEKEFGFKFSDVNEADTEWVYQQLEENNLGRFNLALGDLVNTPSVNVTTEDIKKLEDKYIKTYGDKTENEFEINTFEDILKLKREKEKEDVSFIPSGFDSINLLTKGNSEKAGGWRPGSLYTIMGLSGYGKSIFLANFARGAWERGAKVLYISTEMNHIDTHERIIKSYFNIEDFQQIPLMSKRFTSTAPLKVIKVHPNDTTYIDIQKIIDGLDWKPDVLFIDYADELKAHEKVNSEYEGQGIIYAGLKKLAGIFNIPVITATQTNRNAEHEDGGTKAWVGYGAIADSTKKIRLVDMLFSITQSKAEKEANILNLSVLKNRFGESNKLIPFSINYKSMRLSEIQDLDTFLSKLPETLKNRVTKADRTHKKTSTERGKKELADEAEESGYMTKPEDIKNLFGRK